MRGIWGVVDECDLDLDDDDDDDDAEIFAATSIARPRADVAYCIHALARRLAKTRNWTVTGIESYPPPLLISVFFVMLYNFKFIGVLLL